MGAQRQYTAIFAIGGKLLGSFRGAMNAANMRLAKLRTSMWNFGKSLTKITGLVGLLGSTLAALGVSKILGGLFEGAAEQAKEARQRVNATIASFLQLDAIRKKGDMGAYDRAKAQLDIIYKQNEVLGKQGVLHTDIYNEMTKQLAAGGVPPRQIKATMEGMGDLLVKTRGVNATEEEGAELARALTRAVHGKTKALQAFGIWIDANNGKVKKTSQEILEEFMKITETMGVKGFNIARAMDPEGKIQVLQNRLQDMRENIGNKMLPLQARMAELWLKALPDIEPLMMQGIEWLFTQLTRLTNYIKNDLLPYLKSDAGQKRLKQIGDTFAWIGQHAKLFVIVIASVVAGMWALQAVMLVVNILAAPMGILIGVVVNAIIALVAALIWVVTHWKQFVEIVDQAYKSLGDVPVIGPALKVMLLPFKQLVHLIDWLVNLDWGMIGKTITDTWTDVQKRFSVGWAYLKQGFVALGNSILEALLKPINKVIDGLNSMVDVANKINPFAKIPHIPNISMPGGGAGAGGGGGGAGAAAGATGAIRAAFGAGAGPAGATAAAAGAAGAAGAGIPVTVASYGGPTEPGQTIGAYNNALGPGDVAISPNLYGALGAPGPGSYLMLDGQRYHIADSSWYTPGNPTSNMVELWGFGNQIKRMGVAARAYARGGIAMKPQLATLAERGPEAVLPLASSALSSLGGAGGGDTHVNFSPNITINGNATDAEQRALDGRLRSLSKDFIDRFKAAQYQERRLSYESGYG